MECLLASMPTDFGVGSPTRGATLVCRVRLRGLLHIPGRRSLMLGGRAFCSRCRMETARIPASSSNPASQDQNEICKPKKGSRFDSQLPSDSSAGVSPPAIRWPSRGMELSGSGGCTEMGQ